jgi:hypothetical protein
MPKRLKPETLALLISLGTLLLIWILRGFRLLSFIPGVIIWVLIFVTAAIAVVNGLRLTE